MKVRKGKEKDIVKCVKILYELEEWFDDYARSYFHLDLLVNRFLVVEDKGKIIGFLNFSAYEGILKILWLGVKKKYFGKGAANMLMQNIESEARRMGFEAIELDTLSAQEVYEPYERTRAFYEKLGFVPKGTRMEANCILVVLEKKL